MRRFRPGVYTSNPRKYEHLMSELNNVMSNVQRQLDLMGMDKDPFSMNYRYAELISSSIIAMMAVRDRRP